MNTITKSNTGRPARAVRHQMTETLRPVCGGGYGAKSAQWQEDIGEPNCRRCASIIKRRQVAVTNHEI